MKDKKLKASLLHTREALIALIESPLITPAARKVLLDLQHDLETELASLDPISNAWN